MRIEKYKVPNTRDPFVNTPLIHAGFDPQTGEERFWISTWNANVGCLGALVTASGKSRIYHFEKQGTLLGCGAYSAHLTDNDTMWMVSDLQAFVKLTLSTGEYEVFRTGAPSALVFAGMQYDKRTNKLLAGAFVPPDMHMVSFDINTKTAKIFNNCGKAGTFRGGFPIGDGTYGFCGLLNEYTLYRWDPVADTISKMADCEIEDIGHLNTVVCDAQGRHFIHGVGWVRSDGTIDEGSIPGEEKQLFGRIGDIIYCRYVDVVENVCAWDTRTDEVKTLFTTIDGGQYNLTSDGRIIGVSLYGELTVHSTDGELILSTMLESKSPNSVDCMLRINDELILGTPFISQSFWIMNTKTGEVVSEGRAAPDCGEVLRVWHMNDKVYLASYDSGVLSEFDMTKPVNFPENPKMVCQPKFAMRPLGQATIGDEIFYTSTHHYGSLGCEVIRYNVVTGEVTCVDDPIPGHALSGMYRLPDEDIILCGTTYNADCYSKTPVSDECYITELCPKTLKITSKVKAPAGCTRAVVIGNIDADNILCEFHMPDDIKTLGVYNWKERSIVELDSKINSAELFQMLHYAGDNMFALLDGGKVRITRVEGSQLKMGETVLEDEEIYHIFVYPGEIFAVTPTQIFVIKDYWA